MSKDRLRDVVEADLAELVAFRHDLHRHPELSYEEERTNARVCEELDKLGIAHKPRIAKTGVVAHLPATDGGSRDAVALRADMDALPLTEITGRPYASETNGVMHACGHDGHTAILLGAARAQQARAPTQPGDVPVPAGRGGRRGRPADVRRGLPAGRRGRRRRPARRQGLRAARLAGDPGRACRHPARPAAGGDRRLRGPRARDGRSRGLSAHGERPGARDGRTSSPPSSPSRRGMSARPTRSS
ncbi:MAG: M20/M25/M40 family metallo-hydrolase [Planctomycetota bacterium]|nr:MAG: M20/M25/M40 family metallo-hydrolase [Planctomycetota bacterium]